MNMIDYDIFLSYSWADEVIANSIDSMFSYYKISLFRDVRDLKYKQSLSDFMRKVRKTDYVLMIISENYLKSKNCMYEVLEFIKDDNFKDRILPFVQKKANVFTPEGKLKYLEYWDKKYLELENRINSIDNTDAIPIITELKEYSLIKKEIVEFLSVIADMNSVVFDKIIEKNDANNF